MGAFDFIQVTIGTTKPKVGDASVPMMLLDSVQLGSSGNAGTLVIEWSEDNFIGPMAPHIGAFVSTIGGLTDGEVTLNTYVDASNGMPVPTTTPPLTSMTFAQGAFSGTDGARVPDNLTSSFSLRMEAIITHGSGAFKHTSFDSKLTVPDGGSTLILLGAALASLGLFVRTRRK